MSEGENKFLKLAWNTSQEKPSTRQIVMKQTPEQGVIAGKRGGRQHQPRGGTPVSIWENLTLWEIHRVTTQHGIPAPQECCAAVIQLSQRGDCGLGGGGEGEEGLKLGEFHLARGLIVGRESQESVLFFGQAVLLGGQK